MSTPAQLATPYAFLSYASAEREWALQVADLLEQHGIAMWLDRKSIAGGTSWSAEIVRGIRGCTALAVLVSPESMQSPNVQQEVQLAWEGRRPILPLLLERCELPEAIAYALAGRQWVEVLDRPEGEWLPEALRALAGLGMAARESASAASAARPAAPGPTPAAAPARHNLPAQMTSFVGRERELEEVHHLLTTTRLLTLGGAGGTGKTRLALEVAGRLVADYPDGVWFVALAALADPNLIAKTIAVVLGVPEAAHQPMLATLAIALADRRLLLVLDNCEHLIEGCAHVAAALLEACPAVRILATSREALGITGEVSWLVPPLPVPPMGQRRYDGDQLEALTRYEAVRLFLDRAVAVQPHFAVTNANAPAVAYICWRLDGIPLAIELAAVRVRGMTPEQIAARLDDRFRLLTGGSRAALPRHQTLRATIEWSYGLLTEPEQVLWRRISVFASGFMLEAAEQVGSSDGIEDWEVLDLLQQLVAKSVVLAEERGGAAWYRQLETVRQYGLDRLVETGEAEAVRDRHLRWYVGVAEQAEPALRGADQLAWMDRLAAEQDNIRAALAWARERGEAELALRLAANLWHFWEVRGYYREARAQYEAALALPGADAPTAARALALVGLGFVTYQLGDHQVGRDLLEHARVLGEQIGEAWIASLAVLLLGIASLVQGDVATARPLGEEAQRRWTALGDAWGVTVSTTWSGRMAMRAGDLDTARTRLAEGARRGQQLGNTWLVAGPTAGLGELAYLEGDYAAGRVWLQEALSLDRALGSPRSIASRTQLLGLVMLAEGKVAEACQYLLDSLKLYRDLGNRHPMPQTLEGLASIAAGGQSVRALRRSVGITATAIEQANLDRWLAPARQALSETEQAAAWAEGQALTLEEAVAEALAEDEA